MPAISITLKNLEETVERLRRIPNSTRWVLQQAIKRALTVGKTQASKSVLSMFNLPNLKTVRDQISQPRMSGTTGFIRISGERYKLSMFPQSLIAGHGGMEIQERRSGPPLIFRHAFNPRVFQRRGTSRLPIIRMAGLSTATMITAGKTAVLPAIREKMEEALYAEIHRLTRLILSGDFKVPGGR